MARGRVFTPATCARVICATLENGHTYSEIEDAAENKCGILGERKKTKCEDELKESRELVEVLKEELRQAQKRQEELANVVQLQAKEITQANERTEKLATLLGALIAVFGFAKLGKAALTTRAVLKASQKTAAQTLDDVIAQTVKDRATAQKLLGDVVAQTVRVRQSAGILLESARKAQPLTIEIVGGAKLL